MVKNLFVGNLPFSVTDDQLRQVFGEAGQVVSANLIRDKFTGNSRGFAFVEMGTEEEATRAIELLNGKDMGGRPMNVREALPRPERGNDRFERRDSRGGGGYSGGGRSNGPYRGGGGDRRQFGGSSSGGGHGSRDRGFRRDR